MNGHQFVTGSDPVFKYFPVLEHVCSIDETCDFHNVEKLFVAN